MRGEASKAHPEFNASKVLAEKQIQGKDNLGGSAINPPGHAKTAVPAAFTQKLETLLNSPEIQNAFN